MGEEHYYVKIGRRYHPVERWTGFPADGVWVVKDAGTKSRLLMRLDSQPVDASKLALLAKTKDEIAEVILAAILDAPAPLAPIDLADFISDTLVNWASSTDTEDK